MSLNWALMKRTLLVHLDVNHVTHSGRSSSWDVTQQDRGVSMVWFRQDSIWSLLEPHMSFKIMIQGSRKAHFSWLSCSETRFCCCELNGWQLLPATLWWDMNRCDFLSGSTRRSFSGEAVGSSIQKLSKSWQNAFLSDLWDTKGIKSRPICCLCLAGRIFCIGIGNVWRFLAAVFVITSACPVGPCYVKTGTQERWMIFFAALII